MSDSNLRSRKAKHPTSSHDESTDTLVPLKAGHLHDIAKCVDGLPQEQCRKALANVKPGEMAQEVPLTLLEELVALAFQAFTFGALLFMPVSTVILLAFFPLRIFGYFVLLCLFLVLIPVYTPFPSAGQRCYVNKCVMKYFSMRAGCEEPLDADGLYILTAPPHGVFPIGNILTVQGIHRCFPGFNFQGLAASMVFRTPIFRHILSAMSTIDASWSNALAALRAGRSLGLSSGGVAEVFENTEEHETIVLRRRRGFIRLAMLTGAKVVPCYIFGNTKTLTCFSSQFLQDISRKLGFGVTWFWGRWGLPIPRRIPLFGVMGKPIAVPQYKTREEIPEDVLAKSQAEFIAAMEKLFEDHKAAYGWQHKKLIIK